MRRARGARNARADRPWARSSPGREYTQRLVILLTGATGYIGMRLGARLAATGEQLRCLVLPEDPVDPGRAFAAEVVRGDVTRLDSLLSYGEGVIAIAQRWKVPRIVYLSAVSAAYAVKNAYGSSKAEAERLVRESGLDYTILRLTMVYGPAGGLHF